MLRIGRQIVRTCQGVSRRELLRVGAGGFLAGATALSAPAQPAKAKSIIWLWLWGGPSHIDLFDLKPNAPAEFRGPYQPIKTNVKGIEVGELLPRLARQADRYAIVRSLNHDSNDHGISGTIGLTGSSAGALSLGGQKLSGITLPTHGAVVARARNASLERLPDFLVLGDHLHQGKKRIEGEGGGLLGARFDPFRVELLPDQGVKLPQIELIDGVSPSGLADRKRLLEAVDRAARGLQTGKSVAGFDQRRDQALSLLGRGEARAVFDLEKESPAVREKYGLFRFGQACLLARRLVEAGVAFIQVNWSSHVEPIEDQGDDGWDMHDRNFQLLQNRHAWVFDQALSALLDDLNDRGLLQQTLVVAVGEFGRSPKINNKSGREHWQQCYSGLLAGGGVRGGQVVGASDQRAEFPVERPVSPADLALTTFHHLGITAEQITTMGLTPLGQPIEPLL